MESLNPSKGTDYVLMGYDVRKQSSEVLCHFPDTGFLHDLYFTVSIDLDGLPHCFFVSAFIRSLDNQSNKHAIYPMNRLGNSQGC